MTTRSFPRRPWLHGVLLALVLATTGSAHAAAAPSDSGVDPDAVFDQILRANVTDGRVNYPGIAADPRFGDYLRYLAAPQEFPDSSTALAFWINAYNALAIQGILDGRSPRTLLGRVGYFKLAKYPVAGERMSLYDLERKVIIPLGEPRIHFAINCASASCPKLQSRAYEATQLEAQLEAGTRTFINDRSRNRFDREQKIAWLSKIFDWFEDDFEAAADGRVVDYVAAYVDDPQLAAALRSGRYTVRYLDYDWSLNGTAPDR